MGISIWVSIGPIIPDWTEKNLGLFLKEITEAGVRSVAAIPLRFDTCPQSLALTRAKSNIDCFRSPQYYEEVIIRIKELCRSNGIDTEGNEIIQMRKKYLNENMSTRYTQTSLLGTS